MCVAGWVLGFPTFQLLDFLASWFVGLLALCLVMGGCAPHHVKIRCGANRTTDWRQSALHLATGVKHEHSGWPEVQGGENVVTVHVFYRYRAVLVAVREIF